MHKFSLNRLNLSLLLPGVLIVALTLSVFYSIEPAVFRQQLIFLIFSLIAYFIFLNIDYKFFKFQSKAIYVVMLVPPLCDILEDSEVRIIKSQQADSGKQQQGAAAEHADPG